MIQDMLTPEEKLQNHDTIIQCLRTITREGADVDGLIERLESSDFFVAPASTMYHGAYPGGLADHCMCVLRNMQSLVKSKHLDNITEESVIIVSLLHDLDKVNKYTMYMKNVPPSENNPKWSKEPFYKTVDDSEKFVYGNHEQNSEYLARQFIPLTKEESIAILHHMGGMAYDSAKDNIGIVFNKSPLSLLLYLSDMLSAYVDKA